MLKRWTAVVVLAGLLAAGLPTTRAEAHYIVISGRLVYHSFDCENVLKEAPLPEDVQAIGVCTVVATLVEGECANPNGKQHENVKATAFFPPAAGVITPGTGGVSKKGKSLNAAAHLKVQVAEWDPANGVFYGLENAGLCNNNWTLVGALIREADVTIDSYDCSLTPNQVCTVENVPNLQLVNVATTHCELHNSFTLKNLPQPGDGMNCDNPINTHVVH